MFNIRVLNSVNYILIISEYKYNQDLKYYTQKIEIQKYLYIQAVQPKRIEFTKRTGKCVVAKQANL